MAYMVRSSNKDMMVQNVMGLGAVDNPPVRVASSSNTGAILLSIHSVLSIIGSVTGAYHGYRRNNGSLGWAFGWFLLGGFIPEFTIPVSLGQGFGKPEIPKK